jgi:hypothetical protein
MNLLIKQRHVEECTGEGRHKEWRKDEDRRRTLARPSTAPAMRRDIKAIVDDNGRFLPDTTTYTMNHMTVVRTVPLSFDYHPPPLSFSNSVSALNHL